MIDSKKSQIRMKCPVCNGDVVKRGRRKEKFEIVQKYFCKNCGKNFTDKKLENASFSAKVVMSAITNYNNGMTLEESSEEINKRFRVKTYPKLISSWVNRFREYCSYIRIRKQEKNKEEIIFSKVFWHNQPYVFEFHKIKTDRFLSKYFLGLKNYFSSINKTCPNNLFMEESLRCSQIKISVCPKIIEKENYACKLAGFVLKAISVNKERHSFIEEFMLSNDTSTVAVEIPVWLYPDEVPSEIRGFFKIEKPLTGHIDILQARFGVLWILDYKPDARKVYAVSQLFAYAVALSVRTGIWLRNFRCAWFDEKNYYEFSPSEIVIEEFKKKFNQVGDYEVFRKYVFDEDARQYYTSKEFQETRKNEVKNERV